MANPSPPAASYGDMHVRAGYADGSVLTEAQLDTIGNDVLQQDGSGNAQEVISLRIGLYGFLLGDTAGTPWIARNAYTVDQGNNWYPFVDTDVSYGISISNDTSGISFHRAPAVGGAGALTWATVATVNQFGMVPYSTAITRLTTDANASLTPSYPLNVVRDLATLTANRNLTLATTNAYDGMKVSVARNGSSGGFLRNVYQNDGSTLIAAIPDNYFGVFVYDGTAALWYLESQPFSTAITHLTTDAVAVLAPAYPTNTVRDSAALTETRKLTLQSTNAYDGMRVFVARSGSSGGFSRNVYQADGSTLIAAIADGCASDFVYDGNAALWYLEEFEYSTAITRLTVSNNNPIVPSYPVNTVRDIAVLGSSKTNALQTTNAYDGMRVIFARSGSSGGFVRNIVQNDNVTLIKSIADNYTGVFVYDATAALWYLESYAPCS